VTEPGPDPFDDKLRERLRRLTAAIPVEPSSTPARPPGPARWRPRSRRALAGAALLVAVISLGAAGAILTFGRPSVSSSAFAAGGPLHCSGIDQLAPPDAAAWLDGHHLRVRWQVEDRDEGSFQLMESAPERGAIVDALELDDGSLLVLVDARRDTALAPRPCP